MDGNKKMKQIPLTKGKFAIVDDEDYPYLSRFNWVLSGSGYFAVRHVQQGKSKGMIYMHQLLIEATRGLSVVHKNNDGLDNRKENLGRASMSHWVQGKQWSKEKKDMCSSQFRGVSRRKKRKETWKNWSAQIMKENKYIHIGCFYTEKEAARAYNEKAKELFGEDAYQNKID